MNLVWKNPNKKKGSIFVGDINNAEDQKLLEKNGCYFIVNAQSVWTTNYHEDVEGFNYLRFPIAENADVPFKTHTPEGALRFMNVLIDTIEDVISNGTNVFIHCIAGKHRAGASMVAWVMYKEKLSLKQAIKYCQQRRQRINPLEKHKHNKGTLEPLLFAYEEGLKMDPNHNFRSQYDAFADLDVILDNVPQKKWSAQY